MRTKQSEHSQSVEPDPKVRLARLPPASPAAPFLHPIRCKICDAKSIRFDMVDFLKYCSVDNYYEFGYSGVMVDYWRCTNCGFLFTPFCDDWSHEDFRQIIYNDDYIKVDGEYAGIRPNWVAENFAQRLSGAESARILDYGSGAGVFVERMHDRGFNNIEGYDPFSSTKRPEGLFDIITCFEVIEHATDPCATLADMTRFLRPDGCILLSQTLQPDDILAVRGSWWYLAPRNGHVSTFTEQALETMGRRLGLMFYRGETTFGFASGAPSRIAQIGLSSIGPSFSTLRLYAPSALPDVPVAFPTPGNVWWHATETHDAQQFRWTGTNRLEWRAKWAEVSRLRVQLPVLRQVSPDFAAGCSLVLNDVAKPLTPSRGEMVAEFDVAGTTGGQIELHTPAPVRGTAQAAGRAIGLAIATAHYPVLPPGAEPVT